MQTIMKNKALINAIVIILAAFVAGWLINKLFTPSTPTVATTAPAQYQSTGQRGGAGGGIGFGQIVTMLNFTDAQTAAFSVIEREYRIETNIYLSTIDSLDQEIITELSKNRPDRKHLEQMAQASGEAQRAIKENTIEHFMALRQICEPAQIEKFKEVFLQLNHFRQGQGAGRGQGRGQRYRRGRGWQQENRQ